MSTRSCIILKVRKEDIGKLKLKFDVSKLPVPLDKWEYNESGKNLCRPVPINNQYIGIYCHWDGYPSGVGAALKNHFKDYDSVLNLILGGSCSAIDDSVKHYANRVGEEWRYLAPKQGSSQKDLVSHFRNAWAEYAYLYDEERGGWLYKSICTNNSSKNGFKALRLGK
jgi:hypothetical protein